MTEGFARLGSSFLEPFANPQSRTHWVGLLVFCLVVAFLSFRKKPGVSAFQKLRGDLRHPSSILDVQLFMGQQLLRLLVGVPTIASGWWIATRGVRWADATWGAPPALGLPDAAVVALYSLTLFVVWDLSRFLVHLAMHRIPMLWEIHQVHHSAEVLTPLTYHRVHPIEGWIYGFRGAVATGLVAGVFYYFFRGQLGLMTLMGVPAIGFLLNVIQGNLRHSHVWIGFPDAVERFFLSPAQHQIHHSRDEQIQNSNYGTWLGIWDRMLGSWQPSREAPEAYGLPPEERNHQDDLLSAWLGPIPKKVPIVAALSLALAASAYAEDSDSHEDSVERAEQSSEEAETSREKDGDRYGETMLVYGDSRTPRVAGSAHQVNEEGLERFEYNNIEQVVAEVPGVSTRSEDGFGLRPNIGIRGANSDRSAKITLMEDGILLAPAPYAAPAAYYFPMTTRLVGVEIFKGPSSTRHGPYTIGGALNVLSREIPDENTGGGDVAYGLFNTQKAHAWAGALGDSTGTVAEAVVLKSDGFKVLDGGGPTGFVRSEGMIKSEWLATADQRLELKLGLATEDSDETYLGLSQSDFESSPYRRYAASSLGHMRWYRTQAELEWTGRIGSDVRTRTVLYHHHLDRSWTKFNRFAGPIDTHKLLQSEPTGGQGAIYLDILRGTENTSSPDQMLLIGTNHRIFHSFGLQNTNEWTLETDAFRSVLEFGVRLHGDHVRRIHSEAPYAMVDGSPVPQMEEEEVKLDSVATAEALAVHLHEDLSVGAWHFFPGLRLESIRTIRVDNDAEGITPAIRSTPLPGMGILWEGTDWLDLFVGAHRGFSPVAPGQPEEVSPELSWNYEAGLRIEGSQAHAETVAFYNDYKNLTGQCSFSSGCSDNDVDQQFNGGQATILGVEAVAGSDWFLSSSIWAPLSVSYAYTHSEFDTNFNSGFPQYGAVEAGFYLPYLPQHQLALRAGLAHERGQLSIGLSYRSAMLDTAGLLQEAEIPELMLLDAAVEANVSSDWLVYATANNLTNAKGITSWRPFGARPTAPLQVMAGIKWQPSQQAY